MPVGTWEMHKRLAFNVRRIRVRKGVSQQQLASLTGIERSYLSRLEHGNANPSLTTLERIASALGVAVADLLADPRGRKTPKTLPTGRRRV